MGHDAKRIYYIGDDHGTKKLVIIWLKDLSHKFISLGDHADKIESFQDSSLFKHYLCYVVKRRVEEKINKAQYYKYVKDFHVMNFKTGEIVWNIPESEQVFFMGKNAAELEVVEFVDRIKKLRTELEEESEDSEAEWEKERSEKGDDSGSEEGDHEELLEKIARGIMVIKSDEREVDLEKEA